MKYLLALGMLFSVSMANAFPAIGPAFLVLGSVGVGYTAKASDDTQTLSGPMVKAHWNNAPGYHFYVTPQDAKANEGKLTIVK